MRLDHGAWVLVADGESARFLINAGTNAGIKLHLMSENAIENPPTHEQGSDRPGRFNSIGGGRTAATETDWHQLAEDRFAEQVAEKLNKASLANEFSQLVVVSPPKALGSLRRHLRKDVEDRLVGEIAKEFTQQALSEIEALIERTDA